MSMKLSRAEEPTFSEDQMTLVVRKLCQITRESTLDYAIRVGSLIVHYFYNGDTRIWRSRGPKTQSFRRLAGHSQLPMSPSTLYRCVAVFELCDRLDVVERWSHITVSHLRVVLRLDESEQRRLLSAANTERWSVERLQGEARQLASTSGARRGPQPASELVRLARSVDKLLHSGSQVLGALPELEQILGDEYESVEETLRQSIRGLEKARDAMIGRGQDGPVKIDEAIDTRTTAPHLHGERLGGMVV